VNRIALLVSILLVAAAVGATAAPAAAATPETLGDRQAIVGDNAAHDHNSDSSDTCTFPYETTDATGANVTVEEDPERIVTLNPSAAQTMWEIGARDEVVGVSQYASYLDGADERANVSGPNGPSVERVLNATPDLVLVPNSSYGAAAERVEQIRAQGVPVYVFEQPTSLEYVAEKTERIGRLTGNCEAGAERADEIRRSVELMERALDGTDRPVGLNVFYGYTSGANTFIGDVMETGGLQNGAAENFTGFQVINDEEVVRINPEWIVAPEGSQIPDTAAYESTTALQEDNVIRIDTNLLQQPAPRSVRAAETIMERVHPEAYEEYQRHQAGNATTDAGSESTTESEPTTTPTAATGSAGTTATGTPGFGVATAVGALAVVAVAAAALLARRR